jgi:hypothetical protein
VAAGQAIFADDTPVQMLAPGAGKTATARLWAYGRDERPSHQRCAFGATGGDAPLPPLSRFACKPLPGNG